MTNSLVDALVFIVDALTRLYLLLLLIRLLLPWMGVNFRNPLAQGILKLTSPVVVPIRRLLPPIGRVDTATVVVAFGIQYLLIWLIALIGGRRPGVLEIAIISAIALIGLTVRLFMFAIIIRVLLSWFAPGGHNPAVGIITAITEPLLRPFRRLIPPLGGFDLSPLFAILALGAVTILLGGVQTSLLGLL